MEERRQQQHKEFTLDVDTGASDNFSINQYERN